MPGRRRVVLLISWPLLACLGACGARGPALPTGPGTPFPDARAAFDIAVAECRGVRTLSATLALSGRAGSTALRGNVDAGFEAPEKVRLEGRHPFGRPVFILVGASEAATLYLARENRVLKTAQAAEIVEALIGLPLDAAGLRSVSSGCGFGAADPSGGQSFSRGWVALETGDATTYIRQIDGRWRVVAASRAPLTVFYSDFVAGRPTTLRLRSEGSTKADVTVRLSDVNINVPLDAAAFQVDVPAEAEPLTLDELRRAGPLGDR